MYVRLWFETPRSLEPRVIAHAEGKTLEDAAIAAFAPVKTKGWTKRASATKLVLTRNGVTYTAEVVVPEMVRVVPATYKVARHEDDWYVVDDTGLAMGPYDTREEAEDHRRSLQNTTDRLAAERPVRQQLPRQRLRLERQRL